METFNVRFPEAKGFYRVTTQEGDISSILDEVKSHSEKSQAIADLYLEKKIPLSFIAALVHTETIKFASGITQFGRDISACYGNVSERSAAEQLVRSYAGKGAVFDCYTAWTAEALGILPTLQKLFGKLFVSRSAIDEIATIQYEFDENPGQVMTVSYRDGQYFREELTADQNKERAKAFAERRHKIEQFCEIVPVDISDDASDLARGLIELVGPHVLDAALLASENDRVLLSDDMYFRQVAQNACGTKGIFLQAAITIAAAKNFLDTSAVANAIVGLASLRHAHVALSPAILLQVAKDDETERQLRFRVVTEFIGTKSAEIYSHVRVTILFLNQVWNLNIPDIRKMACSGIIIEQLLRFRTSDYENIIAIIRSELFGNTNAIGYLEAWDQGTFFKSRS